MITLAIIQKIDSSTNLCKIDVPLLSGTSAKPTEMLATMMLPPGIRSGYKVGDVVFISFTENDLGRPVVLGQLYLGLEGKEVTATPDTADLFVCDEVQANVIKFTDGDTTNKNLMNVINALRLEISTLKQKVDSLEKEVAELKGGQGYGLLDVVQNIID